MRNQMGLRMLSRVGFLVIGLLCVWHSYQQLVADIESFAQQNPNLSEQQLLSALVSVAKPALYWLLLAFTCLAITLLVSYRQDTTSGFEAGILLLLTLPYLVLIPVGTLLAAGHGWVLYQRYSRFLAENRGDQ